MEGEEKFSEQKKTAEALRPEVTEEVDGLLRVIFSQRRQGQTVDLEALETAMRSALHRGGAAALTELLQFPAPVRSKYSILSKTQHVSPRASSGICGVWKRLNVAGSSDAFYY